MERPSAAALASFFLPADGPGEGSVAVIALRPEHDAALRGLREVLASGDRSRAALEATDAAIGANPAGYTAWQVRRECLQSMAEAEPAGRDALVKGEMVWVTSVGSENPKNYQVWNHRRRVADLLGPSQVPTELQFTARVLLGDAKNYHAWAHRQHVVARHGAWAGELDFTETLIDEDPANNSAWNHRAWVLGIGFGEGAGEGDARERERAEGDARTGSESPAAPSAAGAAARPSYIVGSELALAAAALDADPENEAPYNYVRALMGPEGLGRDPRPLELCGRVLTDHPGCPAALGLLLDCLESVLGGGAPPGEAEGIRGRAEAVCAALEESDPIRKRYWEGRRVSLGLVGV